MSDKSALKTSLLGVAGVAVLTLEACTGLAVKTDTNPSMVGTSCHTYAFATEHVANGDQASAFGNPVNGDRLRVAIQSNLAARGIQQTDPKSAECIVGYAMGTRQVFDDFYGGWGYGGWGGWGRRGFGWGGGFGYDGPMVQNETRISVDLFDAHSRVPIWHASVSQSVSDLTGPNALVKINAAATAIFSKFPVAGAPPGGSRAS